MYYPNSDAQFKPYYEDISFELDHTDDSVKISMGAQLDTTAYADEYWAFNNFQIEVVNRSCSSGLKPDLRGRFILGSGKPDNTNSSDMHGDKAGYPKDHEFKTGDISGSHKHALTTEQMPSHTHSGTTENSGSHYHRIPHVGLPRKSDGAYSISSTYSGTKVNYISNHSRVVSQNGAHSHSFTTESTGGNLDHNNMPPYYVLAYIVKETDDFQQQGEITPYRNISEDGDTVSIGQKGSNTQLCLGGECVTSLSSGYENISEDGNTVSIGQKGSNTQLCIGETCINETQLIIVNNLRDYGFHGVKLLSDNKQGMIVLGPGRHNLSGYTRNIHDSVRYAFCSKNIRYKVWEHWVEATPETGGTRGYVRPEQHIHQWYDVTHNPVNLGATHQISSIDIEFKNSDGSWSYPNSYDGYST
jgi:microcystin-dependent protein